MPKPLVVQFTPIRSCLVNLPSKWVNALLDQNKLPQNVILEIVGDNKKKIYCGWSGEASKPLSPNAVFTHGATSKLDVLEIDPQLGLAVGLNDGQKVSVEFCRTVAECTTVSVEPLTEDDWEILELHAGYVEENLLSQIRVVYPNQVMCVWIHGKTLVRLVVAELNPAAEVVKLTNMSEVIVAPKVRNKITANEEVNDLGDKQQEIKVQPSIGLRVTSVESKEALSVTMHPDSVYPLLTKDGQVHDKIRLTKLVPAFLAASKKEANADEIEETPTVKALFANVILSNTVPLKHIAIGSILRRTLEIKDFDIVKISTIAVKKQATGSLILKRFVAPGNNGNSSIKLGLESTQQQAQQKVNFENQVTEKIKEWIASQKDQIISSGTILSFVIDEKTEYFMTVLGAKKGLFSTSNSVEREQYMDLSDKLSIEFSEPIPRAYTPIIATTTTSTVMGGVDKVLTKIQQYTLANLSERSLKATLGVPGSGGVLITGSHGCGKSTLAHNILAVARQHHIYTLEINCAEFADERIPVFKEQLQKWYDQASWHGPTLVFFDDLDRLIPAEVEHADSTRSRHLAEIFVKMTLTVMNRQEVMVMATSQQQQSIHPALITHHIFSELNHVQPPNREERKLMMQVMMQHGPTVLQRSLNKVDLVEVASETEGFLAADLKALIERTVHEGAVRSIKQENGELLLEQADFSAAREGFVPSSLRGVKLQSSGVNWSDIGGLLETRKALLETLEWPTKYAAVFAQCPLRLRSGLLLYGYPGCGKTLLASAVAKECGLNFISVKGPEILNKYIGASEKSVRDLFERAQAAKPCVLFFDEFDSIAPRRGHDSTGVTDRVVNQMLTQMDGAEGLDGVYVLAATSRPDLIDPALLRPGRLDKALLCGLPNHEERLDILQALALKMKLADDVDLNVYAEKTEGFSGADLQGFLYNAHLEAIHGAIDMETFKEAQNTKSDDKARNTKSDFVMNGNKVPLTLAEKGHISQRLAMIKKGVATIVKEEVAAAAVVKHDEAAITRAYLDKSLKSTRPSITVEESYRLGLIYNEFVTGRTGELPSGEGDKGIGKRSTLG